MHSSQRGWGEVLGPPVFHPQPPMYTVAAVPPGAHSHPHPHPQHLQHNPYEVVAVVPTPQMQQLVVAQQAEEMRKNAKRAANRRSASTCRQRRKFLVENMADANNRMRKRARVLSLLPDMILAMRRDGVVTYASENCSHFLQFTREEVEGTNIFDLVESGSHNRLRRLLEENLGSVSKEAIASALRHQGTTFESLLARAEKAKEQGDSSFFSASGKPPRFLGGPGPRAGSGHGGGRGGGGGDRTTEMDGSTDDWESEVTNSACESQGRTSSASTCGSARATRSGSGSGSGSSGGGGGGGGGGGRKPRWDSSAAGSSGSGSGGGTSEADLSSGGTGAGAGSGAGMGKSTWAHLRPLPPTAFRSGAGKAAEAAPKSPKVEVGTSGVAATAAYVRQAGQAQSVPSSGAGSSGSSDGTKEKEGGGAGAGAAGRKHELGSDAPSETASASGASAAGGGAKASMVNVDRDLQSKINAFTNAQKDLCKLEIMRQDKTFEWYEVRSSMRLAWLKAKQMIIPVEVICSFQRMHTDSPAGSANSIVARLQRAATIAKSLGTEGNGNGTGDYLSANSSGSSAGFSGGDSNDAGSPDLEDNSNDGGRCDNPSSEGDGQASEAASSDYGGGTSSGSVSGDGNSAPRHNNNNGDADGNGNGNENGNNANRNGKLERKGCSGGGGERSSRKRARRVCAPVSTATVVPVPPRPGVGGGGGGGDWGWGGDPSHRLIPGAANELQQQKGAPGLRKAGGEKPAGSTARSDGRGGPGRGGVVGSLEREKRTATADRSPTSALAFLAAAAAEAAEATRAAPLSTTARRLALSAKKSILIRHGADSQS